MSTNMNLVKFSKEVEFLKNLDFQLENVKNWKSNWEGNVEGVRYTFTNIPHKIKVELLDTQSDNYYPYYVEFENVGFEIDDFNLIQSSILDTLK